MHGDIEALDRLKARIQALRAKTIENGCTESEAMLAAGKVAELLDRHDLSLSDVEIGQSQCEKMIVETYRKKRPPIDGCVGAVAKFCDCRVWSERNSEGQLTYIFFGLRADVQVAHYLTELIDGSIRHELGRYKISAAYRRLRHKDRHLANSSFTMGMIVSIAEKLVAMKEARDEVVAATGRSLVVVKFAVVDGELAKLGLNLRARRAGSRLVAPEAFEAGGAAGAGLNFNPALRRG